MNYAKRWKKRKILIVILAVIGLAISVALSIETKEIWQSFLAGLLIVWGLGTFISSISVAGNRFSALIKSAVLTLLSQIGMGISSMDHYWLFCFYFVLASLRLICVASLIVVLYAYEFIAFPIFSLVYFLKRNKQEIIEF